MRDIIEIVQSSVNEVENEFLNNNTVKEHLRNVYDENGEVDFDVLLSALVEISTHYSNSVLATTLENLEKEGRLN